MFRKKCGGPRASVSQQYRPGYAGHWRQCHTKSLSYLLLQWLSGNFGVLARCRNFFGPHVGAPFLWGPLFGRTCLTYLNPPLDRTPLSRFLISCKNHYKMCGICSLKPPTIISCLIAEKNAVKQAGRWKRFHLLRHNDMLPERSDRRHRCELGFHLYVLCHTRAPC